MIPPASPPLPGLHEFLGKLAVRFPLERAVLERVARRVLEEESEHRRAGKTAASADMLLDRAARLLAAAVPQPPLPDEDEPFGPQSPQRVDRPPIPDRGGPFQLHDALEPEDEADLLDVPPPPARPRWPLLLVAVLVVGVAAAVYLWQSAGDQPDAAVEPDRSAEVDVDRGIEPSGAAPLGELADRNLGAAPEVSEPTAEVVLPPTVPPPTAVPTAAPRPTAAPPPVTAATGAGSVVRQTSVPAFASRDWSGPTHYAVHFSSYRDRANAERDGRRLSAMHGMPARVLEADLGGNGVWYRVMLGEFASAADALAVRNQLAEAGTADLGFVYRVSGVR